MQTAKYWDYYICTRQQLTCIMEKMIYNRIKAVLAEKNVSGKKLAQQLNTYEATVSRWCSNDTQPSVQVLYKIAKILDVDIRELLVSTK